MENAYSTNSLGVPGQLISTSVSLGVLQDPFELPSVCVGGGGVVLLNERAKSNSSWRFSFIPILKFHSGVLWLESPAKAEGGVAEGYGAGARGLQSGEPGVCRARLKVLPHLPTPT